MIQSLLAQTVVIKLNGGLGTSMGLQKAKSLLPVKGEDTFLDIIAHQILHLRQETGANVRFLLMNSFSTSQDTLDHMEVYADQDLSGAEKIELMQNQVPKIDAASSGSRGMGKEPDPMSGAHLVMVIFMPHLQEVAGWMLCWIRSEIRLCFQFR